MSNIGDTIKVTVTFRNSLGEIEDPVSVEWIIFNAPLSATPVVHAGPGVPVKQSDGVYSYDWVTTSAGDYIVRFTGTFSDLTIDIVDDQFTVLPFNIPEGSTLGVDYVVQVASELSPLYVAPEEVSPFFPEATLLEIAEYIHIHSQYIKTMFKYGDNIDPNDVDQAALEYIKAATACSLSRIYDASGGFLSGGETVKLGDFSVGGSSGGSNRNAYGIGGASTWCELASLMQRELLFNNTRGRPFVHGSIYKNPIPERKLRSTSNRRAGGRRSPNQGRLDG